MPEDMFDRSNWRKSKYCCPLCDSQLYLEPVAEGVSLWCAPPLGVTCPGNKGTIAPDEDTAYEDLYPNQKKETNTIAG